MLKGLVKSSSSTLHISGPCLETWTLSFLFEEAKNPFFFEIISFNIVEGISEKQWIKSGGTGCDRNIDLENPKHTQRRKKIIWWKILYFK